MNFATQLRHLLTFLAGLGTLLFAHHLIKPEAVDGVNAAGAQLIDPLSTILAAMAVVAVRLVIGWVGKLFPSLGVKLGDLSGGMGLPLCMGMGLGFMGFSLTSCSAEQIAAARAIPVRIGITTDNGDVSYSSKSGLSVSANARRAVTADK